MVLKDSVSVPVEQLHDLEEQNPCASWLPVIIQNPAPFRQLGKISIAGNKLTSTSPEILTLTELQLMPAASVFIALLNSRSPA